MEEQLLQFIWRYQYFNRQGLCVETGEPLQVLFPGTLNTHQGPDFLNAHIRIGNTRWVGNIELHIAEADWHKHAHQDDPHYRNIILHVVWDNGPGDLPEKRQGEERKLPLLVLQHRVPKILLGKYEAWMNSRSFVACERHLRPVEERTWSSWKRRLLEGRLQRRVEGIRTFLAENHQHWEETTWWLMARNMGLPVNAGAFEAIARSLPVRLLARLRERPDRLEALLLGQAGLLEGDFTEEYPRCLQKEFYHLRRLYSLSPVHQPVLFLRMRPGNFPTVRLAQLATLLSQPFSWFALLREAQSPRDLARQLDITAGSYWDTHYGWEEASQATRASGFKRKRMGEQMKDSLLINTFIPLLYAYGSLRGEKALKEKARNWLEEIRPERNTATTGWTRLGVANHNAADSQALLELTTRYCGPKRCLECAIGTVLLGRAC